MILWSLESVIVIGAVGEGGGGSVMKEPICLTSGENLGYGGVSTEGFFNTNRQFGGCMRFIRQWATGGHQGVNGDGGG